MAYQHPKACCWRGFKARVNHYQPVLLQHERKLPLLWLDVGRLFGGIVGESESRVRLVIKLAEAVSPCCLMLDEIDKAFGNITSGADGDSGTSRRVFGTLLTWMQEKTAPVFVIATANNTEILPAELIRKGRLDELFFCDLPNQLEREQIFQVHKSRLRPERVKNNEFYFELLASHSKDFSGAEIEQVIYEAMQQAFSRNEEFTNGDLLDAIADCVPLARLATHQIEKLKSWAVTSGAKSASYLETSKSQPMTKFLEVD
ncbi:AAA ATPase central domain protein [Microseira wollei NIES-4236]|uniref:AAA ATPase central domain protein n=2 Tax=Microseira wollei TaxID=467598 RepID=A0AAV3XGR1_9CYAN|nr:AAA ATPase central domain protein [Microseira wollei NIES-4236]